MLEQKEVIIYGEIVITPLVKAHQTLKNILAQVSFDDIYRDATIKRFEYTYELFWKTLKKILNFKGIAVNSPRDVFRVASKEGLIENPSFWFEAIEKRNLTTHVYSEKFSTEVFNFAPKFEKEVSIVIERIKIL